MALGTIIFIIAKKTSGCTRKEMKRGVGVAGDTYFPHLIIRKSFELKPIRTLLRA